MEGEHEFLHTLASPLTVALMRLSLVQEVLQEPTPDMALIRQCTHEGAEALERACGLINARRQKQAAPADPIGRKILVVDDDRELREAIAFDLGRRGYQVLHAGSGHQAFEVIRSQSPDMVISDIRMPDGDGVELLRRIKEIDCEVPVLIFITGFADLSLSEAYHLGADAVLSKPFQRAVLLQTVEQCLLTREARWKERPERVEIQASIELRLPDYDTAVRGHLVNLGRGGVFVALQDRLPAVGTVVDLTLHFQDRPPALRCQGVVRWVRTQAEDAERPSGCGLEFLRLPDASLHRVLELIASTKSKAFIPAA